MMMITITVHLNSALDMGSGYDDAATRTAVVSQPRYSEFSMLRHSLTISGFILGQIARAEYLSHIMVRINPLVAKHQHTISEPQKLKSSEISRDKVSKISF